MSDLRARGEPLGSRADGHAAAAACLGMRLLAGTAPARRIVAYRETHGPFRRPAHLLQLPGVGAKRYARLQGMIRTAEAP